MALGKYCSSNVKRNGFNTSNVDAIEQGLGRVHCTRAMGRKRIVVSNCVETLPLNSHFRTPLKRRQDMKKNRGSMRKNRDSEKSLLEALPQDILVHMLCFVDHDDLKRLIQVSKLVRDSTLIAKQHHFAYNTPRSKKKKKNNTGLMSLSDLEFDGTEAPNAPRQQRCPRSRISQKNLSDIAVALFRSFEFVE